MKRVVVGFALFAAVILTGRVKVSTAADPALVGQWSAVLPWSAIAVHSHLLNTGRVLNWERGAQATVWDPATGAFAAVPNPWADLLCAGHTFLSDGRLITLGGWDRSGAALGLNEVDIFEPNSQAWIRGQPMAFKRWYPTATRLPDGRILAVSGSRNSLTDIVNVPEVYDPATDTWTTLTAASNAIPLYPFLFVLPDGRVIWVGNSEVASRTQVLNLSTLTWTVVDNRVIDGGSAVMFQPGKFLKAGTAADSGNTGLAAPTAFVLDMTAPAPAWQPTGSMAFPRSFHNLTMLPDGTTLVVGGGTDRSAFNTANAILAAEVWSPATGTWTTLASMATPRLYHSTALLLPDARVLVAGGGADAGVTDQPTAEIFSPPYLFKGPRPTIAAVPPTLTYGSSFSVATPDNASIASVALVATGSVTHAFNQNQAFQTLAFGATPDGLNVIAPANANLAPPGYYMLFIVNSDGVPSVASFVNLAASGAPPTTVVVPDVVNATQAAATTTITGAGLTVGAVTSASSATVPAGSVISQNPVGGAQVASGSAVALVVSSGVAGAAVAVDTTVFVDGRGTVVSPPINTASAGELLVAFAASDGPATSRQTLTVSGAGLTWSVKQRSNTQLGTSEIWTAIASTTLVNATVTATQATDGFDQSLTVVAFRDAGGTGAVAAGGAPSGAPSVSLTTTQAGSLVYGVGNDWDTATARVVGTSQTMVHQWVDSGVGDTFWVQAGSAPVATAGATAPINDTAPTADQWNLAAIEILTSASSQVAVPNVVGLTQAAATTAITDANLTVGGVTTASSTTVPAGSVISQSPIAGTQVATSSAVALVVSSGVAQVAVPNVVGLTQAASTTAITDANLTVGAVTNASSTTVPAGSVISQSPIAGTQVVTGSAVALVVSSGLPQVTVPNVVGLTQAAATTAITDGNLIVGAVTTASSTTVSAGSVISQTPVAGVQVAPGSAVALVVSSGPAATSFAVDTTVFSDGTGTRVTNPFTTATAGELLVAFVASDGPTASSQTVTVSGAGLDWSLVTRANTQLGTAEIWAATASLPLVNATVTATQSVGGFDQSLTVMAFTGAGGVGASAADGGRRTAPGVSLTTTAAGSRVFGVGVDPDRKIARTPGTDQTLVHEWVDDNQNATFWVQGLATVTGAAGSIVTISDASTNSRWNLAAVEIVAR
jgi:beta-lactam-binding protein with PASTA domain